MSADDYNNHKMEQITKDFAERAIRLDPVQMAVEIRVFVENIQKFQTQKITDRLRMIRERWAQNKDNDTLRSGVTVADILIDCIAKPPDKNEAELLRMVASYDKVTFCDDDEEQDTYSY